MLTSSLVRSLSCVHFPTPLTTGPMTDFSLYPAPVLSIQSSLSPYLIFMCLNALPYKVRRL